MMSYPNQVLVVLRIVPLPNNIIFVSQHHAENDKNLQDDNWRFRQICHETSNPNHPYRRFGTGKTLSNSAKINTNVQ